MASVDFQKINLYQTAGIQKTMNSKPAAEISVPEN